MRRAAACLSRSARPLLGMGSQTAAGDQTDPSDVGGSRILDPDLDDRPPPVSCLASEGLSPPKPAVVFSFGEECPLAPVGDLAGSSRGSAGPAE